MINTFRQSPEQEAYLQAKSDLDTLDAIKKERLGPFNCESEEEIDAFAEREEALIKGLGVDRALHTLQATEKELLRWGTEYAAKHSPNNSAALSELASTTIPKYRNAAIETILKFQV